jgi:hypothetical protein
MSCDDHDLQTWMLMLRSEQLYRLSVFLQGETVA